MTLPETVFVLTTWKDQEYFTETRPGYSLNDAFEDIASGTITDIRAVYVASNGSFEDESDQICDLLIERIRDGHATTLGAASGVVAGLVAITPSCSSVNVVGALAIGVTAGVICALAVGLKFRFGFDDSLDVVGVHLFGGLVGTLMVGLVATKEAPAAVDGLFYGGGAEQLWRQAVGAFAVLGYTAVVTTILALLVKYTVGLRLDREAEAGGIDEAEHAETAYDFAIAGGSPILARHGAEV
ncbi:MAG: hypothetical protein EBU23_07185 [Mycobacteriaceae bacterium]|nr:hypothetical protein [Mycobacteriaceae bacterium]